MYQIINSFVINNTETFAKILSALLLIVIGTPFISFKGGIPRIKGLITNKHKSFVVFVLLVIVTFFIINPITEKLFEIFIPKIIDYTFPLLFFLSAGAVWEWDEKMKWDYKWYWIIPLIIGIMLSLLELFLY